ncbi:hypothetical protein G6F62_005992 [Rhizopus arrhizus]|nr:hypothetical protein G6F62_005992 [Rhizopus arrhizus]
MKFSFIFALILTFTFVIAAPVSQLDDFHIITPTWKTTYKKGEIGQVNWSNGVAGSIIVKIFHGKDMNSMLSSRWTPTIQVSEGFGKFAFFIDSFFNEEEMYRFQIVYNKNGKRCEVLTPCFKVTSQA